MGIVKSTVALALATAALAADENATDNATKNVTHNMTHNITETMPENMTEVLPPLVEFQGKAPKLKIFPGGTKDKEATWYMLEFGAVEEVDSNGKKVNERSISSLAAEKSITWSQESKYVDGTGATTTLMELYLNRTFSECKGGQGRLPDERSVISIETFVFTDTAMLEYGNESWEAAASSLKYNVKSTNWPFCEVGNSLQVNMEVKVKGEKPPKMEAKDMEKEEQMRKKSGKRGKGVNGKKFSANAGNLDLEMDLPTLSIVDGELVDSEVEMDTKGSKTSIVFTFPHFNETLLYDPTVGSEQPVSAGDSGDTSLDGREPIDAGLPIGTGEGASSGGEPSGNATPADEAAEDGAGLVMTDSAAIASRVMAPVACLAMLLRL